MRALLRVLGFSALLVLLIVGGLRLGRAAEGAGALPLSAAGTGPALSPPPVSRPPPVLGMPASLEALRTAGAELVPLGRAGVLKGWLVRRADGSVLTVYAAPGGHVVAGLLYGPDGRELTGGQLERAANRSLAAAAPAAIPAPASTGGTPPAGPTWTADRTPAAGPTRTAGMESLADAVRAAAGSPAGSRHPVPGAGRAALFERSLDVAAFTVGETGPDLVAFLDPGCPWSRQAAAELGQLALDGAFRLHAVPVGLMSAGSHAHAAGILAAPRPGLAWYRSEPLPATAEDGLRLEANNALWRAFGAGAVPFLAWRGADGAVRGHEGLPASAGFMAEAVR